MQGGLELEGRSGRSLGSGSLAGEGRQRIGQPSAHPGPRGQDLAEVIVDRRAIIDDQDPPVRVLVTHVPTSTPSLCRGNSSTKVAPQPIPSLSTDRDPPISVAAFAGALGQAKAAAAALEGIARNPGARGDVFVPFILGLALIESLVIYALLIAFQIKP